MAKYEEDELIRLHKLFDVVRDYVDSSGGDGDGWILIKGDYKKVADLFEAYEKGRDDSWFTIRQDGNRGVTFSRGQESIWIGNDALKLPDWAGDIIVCVFWNAGIVDEG